MTLSRVKWEILDYLGYVFCEASFRWWDLFDDGPALEERCCYPTRWEMLTYGIGVPSFRVGCFFYGLQDDKVARVEVEENNETR